MDSDLLKYHITKSHHSVDDVAKMLGFSRQAFYKRLRGKTDFRLSEIRSMKDYIGLNDEDFSKIFFS